MRQKKERYDLMFLYLPAKGFKARYMPPGKIVVTAGDWKKQPLFLSSLKTDERKELTLFDLDEKEVI